MENLRIILPIVTDAAFADDSRFHAERGRLANLFHLPLPIFFHPLPAACGTPPTRSA